MKTLIWAHRGASAYAPENTLESFELAAKMNADGIELDVHQTSDGVIAVSHDGVIGRCAKDGSGAIREQTYEQLLKYNFNNGMDEKYPHCKLPTLDEVYDLLKSTALTVNVEIKQAGLDFIKDIDACAERHGMQDRVIYSSFIHYALYDMKCVNPNAFTAPLFGGEIFRPWDYCKTFGASAIHPHVSPVLTIENYTEDCHAAGIRIHPWTIDDEPTIRRLLDIGVDAIITNRPDLALRIRSEYK